MIRALALVAVLVAWPVAAGAQDHPMHGVALVIGQSKYEQLPVLTNPSKDARDIDRLLGDLGFEVDRVLNADGDELREAIARFEDEAKDADVALVYYSGHGIEAKGENFIAPTDTDLTTPQSAGDSMIAVQPMLEALSRIVPVTIVLLDACRSDPFPAGQMIVLPGDLAPVPVGSEGLAAVRGPTPVASKAVDPDSLGTVIGFAAEPGEPALDGAPGENSPYAAALLKHFAAGGYSFGDVMTMVTEEVYLKTKAKQLPWTNSSLRRVLSFDAPAEDDADADQRAIKTERRKLLLTIAATPAQTQKYVESLAGQEKVPLDALYGMLNALGIKTTDAGGDLQEQLAQGAQRLKDLLAQKDDSVKADPELERLSKLADDAEAEGAIALALKFRDQASGRADTLLHSKQAEADRLRQDMLDIAGTYAANAATALLNFDQMHAADLYGKAFDAAKDWDKAKALGFKISQGDALTDRGYYNADNDALTAALNVYDEALALAPKDTNPKDWGRLENRLGQAQQTLGARMTDVSMLHASVASFERALTVQTQAAAPDDWAGAQNNLGNVLYSIGNRTKDVPMLEKAVAAMDAALTVFNPTDAPAKWATTQSNRAAAQMGLADAIYASVEEVQKEAIKAGNMDAESLPEVVAARTKAIDILNIAATSLEGALQVRSRADSPLDWAMMQHTRASLLADRGKLAESPDDLRVAADLYREVLTVHDKTKTPVQWSTSAANLASTLRDYGLMTKDAAPLAEAADLLAQAVALTPRAQAPLDWAEFQTKLGNVWSDAVTFDQKPETVDKAVAAYSAALEVNTPEQDIGAWERLHLYIVSTLLATAVTQQDLPRLKQARALSVEASEVLKAHNLPDASMFDGWLAVLDPFIAALSK
ncbi:MAG: caspase family protein [Devosia sp.]